MSGVARIAYGDALFFSEALPHPPVHPFPSPFLLSIMNRARGVR